ncbi:MAG: phosphatidylserine decarboxylase [Polyangia bacterium]
MREDLHQYVDRMSGSVCDERLYWDSAIRFLYSPVREKAPRLFAAMTSPRMSSFLGFLNYDSFVGRCFGGGRKFMLSCGMDWTECLDDADGLRTLAQIFERKIRYWERRPMSGDERAVVAPADARLVCGSFADGAPLFIKGKFFDLEELIGGGVWWRRFADGDWVVLRLTPDKYHYNHAPVAGVVKDFFVLDGACHACNPAAVVEVVTPYSKNRRHVTIIDTDVPGGSQVGMVAMVEVAALMIGDIVQCYSDQKYLSPRPMTPGLFLRRGAPKSRYRPGGSTDVVLFERGRIRMSPDLVRSQQRSDVASRFSLAFRAPLAETEVRVRSTIAERLDGAEAVK